MSIGEQAERRLRDEKCYGRQEEDFDHTLHTSLLFLCLQLSVYTLDIC